MRWPSSSTARTTSSSPPARARPWPSGHGDGEMYLGSDAIALAPMTDRDHLSRGRRFRRPDPRGRRDPRRQRAARQPRGPHDPASTPPPSRRAATSTSWPRKSPSSPPCWPTRSVTTCAEDAPRPCPTRCPTSPRSTASSMVACGTAYLRLPDREILDRAPRRHPGRGRYRQRIPLPRRRPSGQNAGALRQPVGRNRRHARRAALLPPTRPTDPLGRQRPRKLDRARKRHRAADPRRRRNRRRLDQGLHLPAVRARRCWRCAPARTAAASTPGK